MTFRNFIFDIDGTLWDVSQYLAEGWNEGIEAQFGIQNSMPYEWLRARLGKPSRQILGEAFPDKSEAEILKMSDVTNEYEQKAIARAPRDVFYPGVEDTLKTLSQRARVYIVSNCSDGYVELLLEKGALSPYVLDYESYGKTRKSKGENIRLVMARNGLADDDTVYVGDTQMDYEATQEARVPFLFASYGLGEATGNVDRIACIADVLQYVK